MKILLRLITRLLSSSLFAVPAILAGIVLLFACNFNTYSVIAAITVVLIALLGFFYFKSKKFN